MLLFAGGTQALQRPLTRRSVLTTGTAGLLGAEAGWAHAVAAAAAAGVSSVSDVGLPADAVEQLELSVDRISGTRRTSSALVAIWPWLLVAGLVMLVLEWYVYHRRSL